MLLRGSDDWATNLISSENMNYLTRTNKKRPLLKKNFPERVSRIAG